MRLERDVGSMDLWLRLANRQRALRLAARRLLARGGEGMQQMALRGVPDLSLSLMHRLAHGAMVARGAESWTARVGGRHAHRYAFRGRGTGPQVLLLHGLGGSASSMATLVAPLVESCRRVVLLELPGHGSSPVPDEGPLSAREQGKVVLACLEEMHGEGGKVVLVGNSLGGALSLYAAHSHPEWCAGVAGLDPAGADLSEEALRNMPRAFADAGQGAAHLSRMLFRRTPWPFWLIARDFARGWESPTVQRILEDARTGADRSLGMEVLTRIEVPVLIVWGADDRLLPASSVDEFRRGIAGARIEVIQRCGHVPQIERPGLTRRKVTEFVAGLAS